MKKLLHYFNLFAVGSFFVLTGKNLNAQNICAASNTISPIAIQNICLGSSSIGPLTATITTNGTGDNGNITYTWYSNTTNSTTGGTAVQTLSANTGTTTNNFIPSATTEGTLWYYCTVTNDGGDCAGTSFTTAAVQVNVNGLPKVFNVTGGGARCSNGPGVSIYSSNSEIGTKYQLVRDGNTVGGTASGTGHPVGFVVSNPATFTMIATNINTGCKNNMSGSAIVTINQIPTVSYAKTDISCQGSDGSITVTANGGTPAYSYNIDGGSFSSNNTFNDLISGNHTVSVKDANSCVVSIPSIAITNAAPLSVKINQINPGNCTGNDGSITVSRIGGVDDGITPVQYELTGDVTRPYQTSNVFGNLSKGNYTVGIKDSKGCTAVSATVTLTQNAGTAPNAFNVTGGGTRCSNGSPLSIQLSGSQTGVSYQLNKGGTPVGGIAPGTGNPLSFVLNGPGTYTVVATNNSAGCTNVMNGTATIVVNQAPAIFNVTGGGNRCSNGSGVSIYLSGSEIGVNYQLQRNGALVGSIASGKGLGITFVVSTAGTYSIIATNATTNCTTTMNGTATVTVNPAPDLFTVSGGGVSCSSGSPASIKLSGSQAGVSYQLNNNGLPVGTALQGNGSPLSFVTSSSGTFKILATNSSTGCSTFMTGSAVTSQDPPLTPSYTKYYASSCVGGDGTITITPGGGTPGYMYSVDDGAFGTDNFLSGLAAGDHKVVIKDANSCTYTYDAITVLTAPIMKVTANTIPASSCNGNDGSITGLYYGGDVDGITPLQYKLDGDATRPFQTDNTFNGLAAGNYTVTIKDSKGCLAESSTITLGTAAPLAFTPASYSTDVSSCGNGSDGSVSVGVTGGVPPFDFKLNGSDYGESNVPFFGFPNLATGTYTVSVSDLHNCTITQVFTIGQATAPVAKVAYNGDETCIGKNDGYISLSPTGIGGIPPAYSYSDNGGLTYQSSYSFTNLSPATYTMMVKDSKGCVSAPVSITVRASKVSCRAGNATTGTENRVGTTNENGDLSKTLFNASLSVQAYPNPFGSEFTLNVQGNNQDKVFITITDVLGRRLYQAEGNANQQYKLGNGFRNGIYVVQVIQGDNVQTIKLVKE